MSADKKHPLEVFRSSGRSLGGVNPVPPTGPEQPEQRERPEQPERPQQPERPERPAPARAAEQERRVAGPLAARGRAPNARGEFELHLGLREAVVLLFSWLVLMGGAYLFGYARGEKAGVGEVQSDALAKGRQIAAGDAASAPGGGDGAAPAPAGAAAERPFGVLLITYKGDQREKIEEIGGVLREKYGIADQMYTWRHPDGKVEVFLGAYPSAEDPDLARLAARVRRIDDWPTGSDKRPFAGAYPKRHPGDPLAGANKP